MEGGPYYHLNTKATKEELMFRTEEELNDGLNIIAVAVFFSGCKVLAFAIMNNHLHFILEGKRDVCEAFYAYIQRKLAVVFTKSGRPHLANECIPVFTAINNLKQLRDEIVYVIRNPYVDRTNVNMHAYKWCSGYLYFNPFLEELFIKGTPASKMTVNQRRALKHERNAEIDSHIMVVNGTALPSSFVDYHRTESFFENARQFFQWLYKNVESQVEVANRIGEAVVLDDIDLWNIARKLCRAIGGVDKPKELSNQGKADLVKKLKYNYSASNAQISRCTGYPVATINEMFPLSTKTK